MKFSEKMCLTIILKLTKNQGFTLSLEDKFFEKPQDSPLITANEKKISKNCNDVGIFPGSNNLLQPYPP